MKRNLYILLFGFLITSCLPGNKNIVSSATETNLQPVSSLTVTAIPPIVDQSPSCLPPLEDFAFPIGDTNMLPPGEEPLLPSQEWEQISQMPGVYENKGLQHTEILLTRSWNTGTEIWVRGNKGELLRYDVAADEWEAINITDLSSSPMMLFLDNKESLWVARRWNGQVTKLPLFMRYDDNKHQFVEANIIFGNVDALRVAAIKLDAKGLVWVILADDTKRSAQKFQLYSIDLTTSEIKYHILGDEDILPSLTILPDDTIVILGRQSKKYQDRSTLLVYDPHTTQVREIPIAPSIYPYNAESNYGPLLFLDTASCLWINRSLDG